MVVRNKDETNRYVNDLRRFSYSQSQVIKTRSSFLLLGLALLFLFRLPLPPNFVCVPTASS